MTELQNDPTTPSNSDALQKAIFTRGSEIFRMTEEQSTGSIFNKDWWYGRIMDWSMKNEQFKVQMFRFVDVLPYLNSSEEVARHLKEYFTGDGQEMPSVLGWGLGLGALAPGLMASAIRKNVTQMARMFITGSSPDEAFKNLEKMRKEKLCFTVDILGEAAVSEEEAASYQKRYLELIETLAKRAEKWPEIEQIDRDHSGPISKVNVSVKVSSLYSQLDPIDPDNSIRIVKEKIRPIFRRARELGVFINLDMESYLHKDLTLALFKSLMDEPEFADYSNVGIVIQAYLRDSENDLRSLIAWAKRRSGRLTVRLVKGAYWDYETVLAKQRGWPIPVFTNKKETDANYETLSLILLENEKTIKAAFGSHNIRSIAFALAQADRLGVDRRSFEIQMLYGMADQIKAALVKQGLRVREYAPVGELIPGMAYLVRRLLENTSNESFLRAKFSSNASNEELLGDPRLKIPKKPAAHSGNGTGPDSTGGKSTRHAINATTINDASVAAYQLRGFQNEPPLDFNDADTRRAMHDALAATKKKMGRQFPLIIGKKEIKTGHELTAHNPAEPSMILGKVSMASKKEAELALETAHKAQKDWSRLPADMRAIYLERIAEAMRRRKFELAAVEVFEVGKTWREADGDVAEAIDFCMYYARHIRALDKGMKTSFVPGEESIYKYQARGVGVVIAPWNFPLAILTGMTVAAAVCGNAVIMKPAEQSPIIAGYFMDILKEVGLPEGVVNFLPGLGEEVGDYLVRHPKTDFIVFTGSKEVGLQIIAAAGNTVPGQRSVKKVVAEMGGKNAIIVDSDADLDEAVVGTLQSAFGFQGQKCSACSRLIVLEENYEKFIHRLVEGARSLTLGQPENPGTAVGPVIDKESYDRILKRIEQGKTEAKLAFQAEVPSFTANANSGAGSAQGYFVPPTIFVDVPPKSNLGQKEIFGPVIAVMKAKNFDEALAIANDTEFALTGGVYSRSPANLEKAKHEFDVGNLYINRGITGALVGRHPFGGFKMSGVGSKAGGPDYLLQFMEPRAITENTMRRGFAPNTDATEDGVAGL